MRVCHTLREFRRQRSVFYLRQLQYIYIFPQIKGDLENVLDDHNTTKSATNRRPCFATKRLLLKNISRKGQAEEEMAEQAKGLTVSLVM